MTKATGESGKYLELHEQAKASYSAQIALQLLVDLVYRAAYAVPGDMGDMKIERVGMSRGETIITAMQRKLAIRSEKSFIVNPQSNTAAEQRRADVLGRALKGQYVLHRYATSTDIFRLMTHTFLLRGRSALHTVYMPGEKKDPKIRQFALDPLEYFPVRAYGGEIKYFSIERWVSSYEIRTWLEGLDEKMPDGIREDSNEYDSVNDTVRLVEVWDDDGYCRLVGGQTVQEVETEYDGLTLQEARLGETNMKDSDFSCRPLLASIIPELEGYASLMSKQATGVENFFYPFVAVVDRDGTVRQFKITGRDPAEPIELAEGTEVKPLIIQPNYQVLDHLASEMGKNIGDATLSDFAMGQDVTGDTSGFLYNSRIGQIKDDLSDSRDVLQVTFGAAAGDVLRLWEKFADEQPDGGWTLPIRARQGQRRMSVLLKKEDIQGHGLVEMRIDPALPENKLQTVAMYGQMNKPNPVTGVPDFSRNFMLEYTGIADAIGDRAQFDREWEKEYLLANDQDFKAIQLRAIRAKFKSEELAWKRQADSATDDLREREGARKQKQIEGGLDNGAYLPPEIANDPSKAAQWAQLIIQAGSGQAAAEMMKGGGLPLGQPGQPSQAGGNDQRAAALVQRLIGGEPPNPAGVQTPQPPEMNGATGYNTGIDTGLAPPAQLGAQPRQATDQANLQVDQMNQLMQTGQPGLRKG